MRQKETQCDRQPTARINSYALLGIILFLSSSITNAHPPGARFLCQRQPDRAAAEVLTWCNQHGFTTDWSPSEEWGLSTIIAPQIGHDIPFENLAMATGLFEYVEPDFPLRAARLSNDQAFQSGQTWALQNTGQQRGRDDADIDAPEAWEYRTSAANIVVAVIDSGIRYTHEDLASNMWRNPGEIPDNNRDDDRNGVIDDVHGYNPFAGNGDPWDDDGHGTAVAGVIGAVGNNRIGTVGVAWEIQLMALKFLDGEGGGFTSHAVASIDYALSQGADIINASWGGNGRSRSLERAIRRASMRGVLFVTAAGNDGINIDQDPDYPASYPLSNIITVGSTSRLDRPDSFSNFGRNTVELFAPGSQIFTCGSASDRSYTYTNGTSLAAPFVTGALALMLAESPDSTGFELTENLLSAVDPVTSLRPLSISGGRLNLASALATVSPPLSPPTPLSIQPSQAGVNLTMTTSPNKAFLLEVSDDLVNWRGSQRVESDNNGQIHVEEETAGKRSAFFRLQPLSR